MDRVSEQFLRSITEERDATYEKFVKNDAHRPPIDRFSVALSQDDFWRDVFRGTENLFVRKLSGFCVDVSLV